MMNLLSTALVVAGIFVIGYPVLMFFMNTILTRMEAKVG